MSCLYRADMHSHLLHDLHSVGEGEGDAFLRRTQQMRLGVAVELNAVDRGAGGGVAEHTLGAVAEGGDGNPNSIALPYWPETNNRDTPPVMRIDTDTRIIYNPTEEKRYQRMNEIFK